MVIMVVVVVVRWNKCKGVLLWEKRDQCPVFIFNSF